jgi:hypothetical protein
MSRLGAFAIHLAASLVIGAAVWATLALLWFPGPLFRAEGARDLATLIIGVDVVLGPLLTLIVYKTGKPGLRRDIAVIVLLQLAALIYGLDIMRKERPVFMVAAVDRLIVTYASEYSPEDLAVAPRPEFRRLSWTGPVLVAAVLPQDPKEREQLMFESLAGGKDVHHLPRYFVPYEQQSMSLLIRAQPAERLADSAGHLRRQLEAVAAKQGLDLASLWYVPLHLRRASLPMILDGRDGRPLLALDERQD